MFYDPIGKPTYTEYYDFDFRCELLHIVNDKIRLHYWIPINDENYRSKNYIDIYEHDHTTYNTTTVFYWRSTGFSAQIFCNFDDSLINLTSFYSIFHTKIGKNLTAYNNWNFSSDTSSRWWDSVEEGFWFADTTTMIAYTVPYVIGLD